LATLKNLTNDVYIILFLRKTKEFPKWVGYTLKVFTKKKNKTNEFLRLKQTKNLYFENFIDPEISALCNALDSVANGKINNYMFEPIDEKDFRLEIRLENNYYKVGLFMEEAILYDTYEWNVHSMIGLQMNVKKENIIDFSNELKKEISNLLA